MATFKTETIRLNGKKWKKVIKIFKDGRFEISLPEEFRTVLGIEKISAETLDKVEKKFKDIRKEYEAAVTVSSKVILYEIEYTAYIFGTPAMAKVFRAEEPHDWDSMGRDSDVALIHQSDLHFANGTALSICCDVFEEFRTERPDGSILYRYEPVESSLPAGITSQASHLHRNYRETREENLLEWTPEREKFFADLGHALDGLIMKLFLHFKTPGSVQEFADSGRFILDAPEEQR